MVFGVPHDEIVCELNVWLERALCEGTGGGSGGLQYAQFANELINHALSPHAT